MPQLIRSELLQFFETVDFSFQRSSREVQTFWKDIAEHVPSSSKANVYPWIGELPSLREWWGPRIVNNLASRALVATNKDYELTIGIDVNDYKDDQIGLFNAAIKQTGIRNEEFPDEGIANLLENGQNIAAFDGQNFFDDAHPVDVDRPAAGTFDNDLVGSDYDLAANPKAVFSKVLAHQRKFKRDDGKSLNIRGNILVVAPDWETAALEAVQAEFITQIVKEGAANVAAAAPTNVLKGRAKVVVLSNLTKQDAGFLLATDRGIKPFIFQDRENEGLVARTDPNSDNVFLNRRFEWGLHRRGAFLPTLPHLAVRFAAT